MGFVAAPEPAIERSPGELDAALQSTPMVNKQMRTAPWLIAIALTFFAGLAQMPGRSSALAAGSSEIGALIAEAQGTYPASQLTLMCVAVHHATATAAQNLALMQKLGTGCARVENNWGLDRTPRLGRKLSMERT